MFIHFYKLFLYHLLLRHVDNNIFNIVYEQICFSGLSTLALHENIQLSFDLVKLVLSVLAVKNEVALMHCD